MGFLLGFVCGMLPQKEPGIPYSRIGYFFVTLVLIMLYNWFEGTSHKRHLSRWLDHHKKGKGYFILTHYVLGRAIPILFLFSIPLFLRVDFGVDAIKLLICISVLVFNTFIYFGRQEWSSCEEDFSIQMVREAAERIKQSVPTLTAEKI